MGDKSPYHDGELAVQRRVGVERNAEKIGRGIHPALPAVAAEFLSRQPFVVLGGADREDRVWASLVTGPPGFAKASGPATVELGRLPSPGDPLALVVPGRQLGLLAIDLATRKRMRVNGRVRATAPSLVLAVEEAYSNCPKYIQARIVEPSPGASAGGAVTITHGLSPYARSVIAGADTFFIATLTPEGGADASHRGGAPGFVRIDPGRVIVWPDYPGNMMFNTLGNIEVNPKAGLLFLDLARGRTVQLTGLAVVDWDGDRSGFPGAERLVRFEPELEVVRDAAIVEAAFLGWSPHNPEAPRGG